MFEKRKQERSQFLKSVKVLCDTREQKNAHILKELTEMGIMTESRKLDYGDYSFMVGDKDFSMSCVVERKANVEEIYTNLAQDSARIEKEFYTASQLCRDFTLLVENIESWEELRAHEVPEWQMQKNPERKVKMIGAYIYPVLKAWAKPNMYGFRVEFVKDHKKTAAKILETFYYYWQNYKDLTAARR